MGPCFVGCLFWCQDGFVRLITVPSSGPVGGAAIGSMLDIAESLRDRFLMKSVHLDWTGVSTSQLNRRAASHPSAPITRCYLQARVLIGYLETVPTQRQQYGLCMQLCHTLYTVAVQELFMLDVVHYLSSVHSDMLRVVYLKHGSYVVWLRSV